MLGELPHFNNARRYVAPLLIIGAIFAVLGLALTGAISAHANAYWRLDLPIPRSLGFLGAAFLVGALDKYALSWIKQVSWATDLTKSSAALTWNERSAKTPTTIFIAQPGCSPMLTRRPGKKRKPRRYSGARPSRRHRRKPT